MLLLLLLGSTAWRAANVRGGGVLVNEREFERNYICAEEKARRVRLSFVPSTSLFGAAVKRRAVLFCDPVAVHSFVGWWTTN